MSYRLLFGTSFTSHPEIQLEHMVEACEERHFCVPGSM